MATSTREEAAVAQLGEPISLHLGRPRRCRKLLRSRGARAAPAGRRRMRGQRREQAHPVQGVNGRCAARPTGTQAAPEEGTRGGYPALLRSFLAPDHRWVPGCHTALIPGTHQPRHDLRKQEDRYPRRRKLLAGTRTFGTQCFHRSQPVPVPRLTLQTRNTMREEKGHKGIWHLATLRWSA